MTDAIGLHLDRHSLAIFRGGQISVQPILKAKQRDAVDPGVFGAQHLLDELRQRLLPAPAAGASAVFAVPGDFDVPIVSRLARICQVAGLDDVAFVDAAALTMAVEQHAEVALMLQLGWRDFIVGRVRGGEQCVREKTWLHASMSLARLHDRWVESIAAAMVKQTRFDPLHDRGGERSLFSQLPRALEEATGDGQTRIVVTSSGSEFAVTLSSQHFEEVAATDYAAIIDALLAARGEAKDLLCVVPQATLHWPGFMARLSKAIDARVVGIPDGLLAKVACSLVGHFPAAHATWRVPKLSNSEWQVALVKDGAP